MKSYIYVIYGSAVVVIVGVAIAYFTINADKPTSKNLEFDRTLTLKGATPTATPTTVITSTPSSTKPGIKLTTPRTGTKTKAPIPILPSENWLAGSNNTGTTPDTGTQPGETPVIPDYIEVDLSPTGLVPSRGEETCSLKLNLSYSGTRDIVFDDVSFDLTPGDGFQSRYIESVSLKYNDITYTGSLGSTPNISNMNITLPTNQTTSMDVCVKMSSIAMPNTTFSLYFLDPSRLGLYYR